MLPEVESGEGGESVDHCRNVCQAVVSTVQNSQILNKHDDKHYDNNDDETEAVMFHLEVGELVG